QRGVRHSPKFLPLISCAAFSYPENTCMPRTPARQLNNLWITRKHAGLGQKNRGALQQISFDGLQKGHSEKQDKNGNEHSDVTAAEKAAVDCQKESSGIASNYSKP